MRQIKLCGMFRPEDIQAVNRLKPDYCGFVVNFPKSHRSVSVEQLRQLRAGLDPEIRPVGVFVDQPAELVAGLLEDGTLAVAQLHGTEDETYLAALRALTDKPVWQAFQIHGPEDVRKAAESSADFVLLDAGQGGGTSFAWELLEGFPRPFGLAGGLKEENLPQAKQTAACLLDVSGGIETDKKKDPGKMERFVALAREDRSAVQGGKEQ